ncbi:GCN5-related N-acetyltransferase 3, chloroplastic-like [Aristolochia californica]|uniref:GCN5-related N-acetyltransferase 3, chloroplastic-like n=1 Tax=Aristolochia californica TaxID=171875 RepID=UPI0035E2C552
MGFSPTLSLNFPPSSYSKKQNPPPIFISTNASHISLLHLQRLYQSVNLSPERFPRLNENGCVEPVNLDKLRIAVSNSSVVVSVFCKRDFSEGDGGKRLEEFGLSGLIESAMPVSETNGELVGFGRAVSDNALTASIYDVMVIPQLQRIGIGRRIVNRIIRVLTNGGVYDISAICSEQERLFFTACGFGNDVLGSTTMMYTRTPLNYSDHQDLVKHAGRKLLLVPPPIGRFPSQG